jgi:hypothetical protein
MSRKSTTFIINKHKYIRRDGSCQVLFFAIRRKSLQRKEIYIDILSHFRRIPTFENFINAVLKLLRRKEFGKIGATRRIELYQVCMACLR